jgi:hypothetical protein
MSRTPAPYAWKAINATFASISFKPQRGSEPQAVGRRDAAFLGLVRPFGAVQKAHADREPRSNLEIDSVGVATASGYAQGRTDLVCRSAGNAGEDGD